MKKRTWLMLFIELSDGPFLRWVFRKFGRKIVYTCEWGSFDQLYNSIDLHMGRPCHPDMSVAPPWSDMQIVPLDFPAK